MENGSVDSSAGPEPQVHRKSISHHWLNIERPDPRSIYEQALVRRYGPLVSYFEPPSVPVPYPDFMQPTCRICHTIPVMAATPAGAFYVCTRNLHRAGFLDRGLSGQHNGPQPF